MVDRLLPTIEVNGGRYGPLMPAQSLASVIWGRVLCAAVGALCCCTVYEVVWAEARWLIVPLGCLVGVTDLDSLCRSYQTDYLRSGGDGGTKKGDWG
jgi:hypothetical protein